MRLQPRMTIASAADHPTWVVKQFRSNWKISRRPPGPTKHKGVTFSLCSASCQPPKHTLYKFKVLKKPATTSCCMKWYIVTARTFVSVYRCAKLCYKHGKTQERDDSRQSNCILSQHMLLCQISVYKSTKKLRGCSLEPRWHEQMYQLILGRNRL